MYAVVSTGGKQYRLTKGAVVDVERVSGEVGDQVVFDQVLFLGGDDDQAVGGPTVKGARVLGTIVEQGKGDKVVVFKYKKRKMYRRRTGHRQLLTRVRVEEIQSGGSSAPPPAQKAERKSKAKAEAPSKPTSPAETAAAPVEESQKKTESAEE